MSEAAPASDARYSVHSLELGLRVLECFDRNARDALNLSEIARHIGISRSSAFRLVHTLERLGYLAREDETKSYRLGARVMLLGHAFLASKDIAELARPELRRLRAATRCSTHLGILDGPDVLYIARYAAHEPVGSLIAVGARLPAHATTMGRMLLAYKPAAYVEEHFAGALAKVTEHTPATLAELQAVLDEDRVRGYAISHSNFESGIASIAAPVFDASDEVVAAINVSIPEAAIDDRFDTSVRDAVCQAARTISQLAGQRARVRASWT
jgi:IclR family pca regulon transcriptional regulator